MVIIIIFYKKKIDEFRLHRCKPESEQDSVSKSWKLFVLRPRSGIKNFENVAESEPENVSPSATSGAKSLFHLLHLIGRILSCWHHVFISMLITLKTCQVSWLLLFSDQGCQIGRSVANRYSSVANIQIWYIFKLLGIWFFDSPYTKNLIYNRYIFVRGFSWDCKTVYLVDTKRKHKPTVDKWNGSAK